MENQLACDGFFFEPEIECYREYENQQDGPAPSPKGRAFFGIGPDGTATNKERRGSLIGLPWIQPSPTGRQQANVKDRRDSLSQGFRRNSLLWFAADEPWNAEPPLANTNLPDSENLFSPKNLNTVNPPRRMSVKGEDMFFGNEWKNNLQNNAQRQNEGTSQKPLLPMPEWCQGSDTPKAKQIMPPLGSDDGNFAPSHSNNFAPSQNNDFSSSQRNSFPSSQNAFPHNNYGSSQNNFSLPPMQNNLPGRSDFSPAPISAVTKLATEPPTSTPKPFPAPAARKPKGSKPRCRTNKKPQYWTPDEHEKFLAGLEKFSLQDGLGPGGAELLSMWMGNRSVLQIKSHAQKYWSDLAAGRVTCPR